MYVAGGYASEMLCSVREAAGQVSADPGKKEEFFGKGDAVWKNSRR